MHKICYKNQEIIESRTFFADLSLQRADYKNILDRKRKKQVRMLQSGATDGIIPVHEADKKFGISMEKRSPQDRERLQLQCIFVKS